MEPNSDVGQLLQQCRKGNEQALAQMIQHYEGKIYHLCLSTCGDSSMAEDATVNTFYKIWCKAGQWRGQTSPEAWMYRIAVRTTLDVARGHRRWYKRQKQPLAQELRTPGTDPMETLAIKEQQQNTQHQLERALLTLQQEDRALIHLYYYQAKNISEIADILNKTVAALKMRLSRARKQLRQILEDQNNESGISS